MSVQIGSILKSIGQALARMGLKKPWEISGPRASPEFVEFLPQTGDYRKNAPGSTGVVAIVPFEPPEFVYDIKYHVRDYRRNNWYAPSTVKTSEPFDFEKMYANAPLKPEDVKLEAPVGAMPTRGF
jgi:hypothetical protein